MKKQWQIRRAVSADVNGLQSVMHLAYMGYVDRMDGQQLPPMALDYATEIKNYPTWVAESNHKIVAGLTMTFEEEYASIANIAVDPDFQGQGLGSGLMTFAEDQARQKNYAELRLATHVLLSENLSLYQHLGWTEYDRDAHRVFMRKEII